MPSIFKAAEAWIQSLRSEAEASPALVRLIERVGLKQDRIQVSIKLPIPSDEGRDVAIPNDLALARFVPMRMKRRGVEMRLIIDGDAASLARVDLPLLNATARAYRWSNDLLVGQARSIGEIARREHLTGRHVRRVMRLAFLAPSETFSRYLGGGVIAEADTLGTIITKIRGVGASHQLYGICDDLEELNDYTKRYHHGENQNAATEPISETELHG